LLKDFDQQTNPILFSDKLHSFLGPTAAVRGEDKPTITKHYADTFKAVDNFNQLLSLLHWPFKVEKVELVWFINCIILLAINSWSVWKDINAVDSLEDTNVSVKQFVKDLCDELLGQTE
jgi:hypothetical protein